MSGIVLLQSLVTTADMVHAFETVLPIVLVTSYFAVSRVKSRAETIGPNIWLWKVFLSGLVSVEPLLTTSWVLSVDRREMLLTGRNR